MHASPVFLFFSANQAPNISVVDGLTEVSGENLLYIQVGIPAIFSVNGSDDGQFTYALNSSVPGVQKVETQEKADINLTIANTDPQSLR